MPNYQLRFICLKQLGSVTINFKTSSDDKKLVLNCCLVQVKLLSEVFNYFVKNKLNFQSRGRRGFKMLLYFRFFSK